MASLQSFISISLMTFLAYGDHITQNVFILCLQKPTLFSTCKKIKRQPLFLIYLLCHFECNCSPSLPLLSLLLSLSFFFLPFPTYFLPQSLFSFPPLSLPPSSILSPTLPSYLPLILLFLMKGGRKHLGKGGYDRGELTSSPELIDSKVFLKLKNGLLQ